MNVKTAFFLAFNSIKRGNKGTLLMTILIMTLAYVNLVFVSSIFGGIVEAINQQAIDYQYANIVIEPSPDDRYIDNKAMGMIKSIPGVVGSSAHYIDKSVIEYDAFNDGKDIKRGQWALKSINPIDEKNVTKIHDAIIEGSYLEERDTNKILIGKEVSGGHGGNLEYLSLGVSVGDKINVTFANGIRRLYEVKGIFSTKSTAMDQTVFITEKEMESVLKVRNQASEILVKTQVVGGEDWYIEEIRSLGFKKEDIKKWSELMGFTSGASSSFDMISIILGVIGTVVAGITIFIIIFVSVVNKRKQIGILKAIGMTRGTIVLHFVIQALFYGLVGIIIGAATILFIIRPYFLSNPLDFPVGWVSLKVTFDVIKTSNLSLMAAALIGGFFPAYRGAKESILTSLWG
ncbi:MAG: FtsX-like permease family protein [Patescibacteria group bacterium]|nr:FtsX-like permease family protein [Patescibacteria group bacterium]